MKINSFDKLKSVFFSKENTRIYKSQLEGFWSEYKDWWFEPFVSFRKEYREKQGYTHGMDYIDAENKFEYELRKKNDMLSRFYDFMDESCPVYLNATRKERMEIRMFVQKRKTLNYPENIGFQNLSIHNQNYRIEHLIIQYIEERALSQLLETGEEKWLLRGLVALSIENRGAYYQDSVEILETLYIAGLKKEINPQHILKKVSNISSNRCPREGLLSMRKIMTNIHTSKTLPERIAYSR